MTTSCHTRRDPKTPPRHAGEEPARRPSVASVQSAGPEARGGARSRPPRGQNRRAHMCSNTANSVPRELLKGAHVLKRCKYWGQKPPPFPPSPPFPPLPPSPPLDFWSVFWEVLCPLITKKKRTICSRSEQSSRAERLPACSRAGRHPAPCSSAEPGIQAAHLVTHAGRGRRIANSTRDRFSVPRKSMGLRVWVNNLKCG